jgi:hypothetical protein
MTTKPEDMPGYVWLLMDTIKNLQTRVRRLERLNGDEQQTYVVQSAYFDLVTHDAESFTKAVERRYSPTDEPEAEPQPRLPLEKPVELVTLQHAADSVGRSKATIRRWVRKGLLDGQPGPMPAHGGSPHTLVSLAKAHEVADMMDAYNEHSPHPHTKRRPRWRPAATYRPSDRRTP